MATYKEIKGVTVQTKDTDPNLAGVAGATFASGGNLPTALSSLRGLGPQTAAVAVGGTTAPGPANSATFHYDGSSWSTPPATLNTARGFANISKLGTQTAGIYFGGSPYAANNESYNGSAWTEVNDLNTARQELGGSGTQAAALATGGRISSPAYVANNESWNGSSWTEVNDLNTARGSLDSTGTSTDSIAAGGTIAPASPVVGTNSETWDGTSWTTTTSFSTARRGNSMFGLSSTDALVTGGDTSGNPFPSQSLTGSTEYWNGSSWTELADLATGRSAAGSSGSSTAGLVEGGYGPPSSVLTATEEWTQSSSPVLVEGMLFLSAGASLKGFGKAAGVPAGTWASGTDINTARDSSTGVGTATANLVSGGNSPSNNYYTLTEQWNGSSWTEKNDLNVGRRYAQGNGSSTSALFVGGVVPPGNTNTALNEQWDGSSWTEIADLNTARRAGFSSQKGTVTATIVASGNHPGIGNTESWDGSSWTEVADVNTGRESGSDIGIQTSAIFAGGMGNITNNEIWDGTSWTESAEINTGRHYVGSGGNDSTLGFIAGGNASPGPQNKTEVWNGTSWTEVSDMATGRFMAGQTGGSAPSGMFAGGYTTTVVATTEEWTADAALSTVTVS